MGGEEKGQPMRVTCRKTGTNNKWSTTLITKIWDPVNREFETPRRTVVLEKLWRRTGKEGLSQGKRQET